MKSEVSAVLISDLHLHHTPLWRLDEIEKELTLITTKYSKSRILILLGDVFEINNRVEASVLNVFLKFIGEWCKFNMVYWITGQHDSYLPGKATLFNLDILNNNLTIVDGEVFKLDTQHYLIPYFRDKEEFISAIQSVPANKIVFTHLPVAEALNFENDLISSSEFSSFKRVFAGDIHSGNTYGNIEYVGVFAQRNWTDTGYVPKYMLYNNINGVVTTEIKNTNTSRFIEVEKLSEIPKGGNHQLRTSNKKIMESVGNRVSYKNNIDTQLVFSGFSGITYEEQLEEYAKVNNRPDAKDLALFMLSEIK